MKLTRTKKALTPPEGFDWDSPIKWGGEVREKRADRPTDVPGKMGDIVIPLELFNAYLSGGLSSSVISLYAYLFGRYYHYQSKALEEYENSDEEESYDWTKVAETSQQKMANAAHMNLKTAQRALTILKDMGWVKVFRRHAGFPALYLPCEEPGKVWGEDAEWTFHWVKDSGYYED